MLKGVWCQIKNGKKSYLDQGWYQGETLITCIGQGFNLTSPFS